MERTPHDAAPNQFLGADGVTHAYRRFGADTGTPLLFLQHLRGSMDYGDPAVTDGLAAGRPVILFDNEGVGLSSGKTPSTFEAQVAAILDWRVAHGEPLAELATITAPTLVVNGSRDIMAPTVNSYVTA